MSVKRHNYIYTERTVLEAARARLKFLFNEFPFCYVAFSGGKDSTVLLHLALEAAKAAGKLPLHVCFIDMEFEWFHTVRYMRQIADRDDIRMHWYQVPFDCNNAGSLWTDIRYWDDRPGKTWVRQKEIDSIHVNPFFKGHNPSGKPQWSKWSDLVSATSNAMAYRYGSPALTLVGLRASESPTRRQVVTKWPGYKWITWIKGGGKARYLDTHVRSYTAYPIYDFRDNDIWRAIHDHEWSYCDLYNRMWQYGSRLKSMRLSSLIHENAIHTLGQVRDIDPELWNAMLERLPSIHSAERNSLEELLPAINKLPTIFESWKAYRDYLLENLILDNRRRADFAKVFGRPKMDPHFVGTPWEGIYMRECAFNIVRNYPHHLDYIRNHAIDVSIWREEQEAAGTDSYGYVTGVGEVGGS